MFLTKNNYYKKLVLFLSIAFFWYILFPNLLYKYFIPPIIANNNIYVFGDWTVIFSSIKCKSLGFDVFLNNPCDILKRNHVYGSILLFLPFYEKYLSFYYFIIPIFINLLFIYILIKHLRFENFVEIVLFYFFVFSPSTLLAMERLNFDLIIFLFLFLICYCKNDLLKIITIVTLTLSKFYTIVCSYLFLIKGNFYNNFLKVLLLFIAISIGVFLDWNNLVKIFYNTAQFTADDYMSFSIYSFLRYLNFKNTITTLVFLVCVHMLLIVIIFFYINKKKTFVDFNLIEYEKVLFSTGSLILISTYFIFKNIYYREIFLFLTFPYLLSIMRDQQNNRYIFHIIVFFIFRYFIFIIANYYAIFLQIEYLLIVKFVLDIFLICILSAINLNIFFSIVKKFHLRNSI